MKKKILTTKELCILMIYVAAIMGCFALVAFLIDGSLIDRFALWASLVLGTGSLIASVVAIGISIITAKREESLRRQKLEEDANKFINENGDEILYIPLCLIANAYDNHHKFSRKIYNSFNVLNKELQKEVLKQLNYEYDLIAGNHWIDKGIEAVKRYIADNDLGDDFLYDNAKYFHRAMKYPNEQYDSRCEYGHIMPDYFNWNPKIYFEGDKAYQENVSFSTYLESYIYAKRYDKIKYAFHKSDKPLSLLARIFDFSNCSEMDLSYWMMLIVESVTMVIIKEKSHGIDSDEIAHISKGDATIETFEDRYLDVLMELYNLHLLQKSRIATSYEK